MLYVDKILLLYVDREKILFLENDPDDNINRIKSVCEDVSCVFVLKHTFLQS